MIIFNQSEPLPADEEFDPNLPVEENSDEEDLDGDDEEGDLEEE